MYLKFLIVISLYSSLVQAKNFKLLSCSSSLPEVCGLHATCVEEDVFKNLNEPSHCKCNSNAYGEPPNCKSKCKEDCNLDEYCDTNQKVCIKKYEKLSKIVKIGCPGDNFCNDDEYCDVFKNACTEGCRDDESCEKDEYCDIFNGRVCKKGCRKWSNNCKKGKFCSSDSHTCEKGCEHDTHCKSNEICNLSDKKCYSYCYVSKCGNNSVCSIIDHNRHCSCQPGYIPVSKVGCEPKGESDTTSVSAENLDCQKYCGRESLCGIENNIISCYCRKDIGKNPFVDCSLLSPIIPPSPIGPGCIAVLCG